MRQRLRKSRFANAVEVAAETKKTNPTTPTKSILTNLLSVFYGHKETEKTTKAELEKLRERIIPALKEQGVSTGSSFNFRTDEGIVAVLSTSIKRVISEVRVSKLLKQLVAARKLKKKDAQNIVKERYLFALTKDEYDTLTELLDGSIDHVLGVEVSVTKDINVETLELLQLRGIISKEKFDSLFIEEEASPRLIVKKEE